MLAAIGKNFIPWAAIKGPFAVGRHEIGLYDSSYKSSLARERSTVSEIPADVRLVKEYHENGLRCSRCCSWCR